MMTPLIEIPDFNWSGPCKKIELGPKQAHIIQALFELAEIMGGVTFAAAAYRVLQLAPQVLEHERRINRNVPAQAYGAPQVPAHDSAPMPLADVPAPAPRLELPSKPSSVCAADLI